MAVTVSSEIDLKWKAISFTGHESARYPICIVCFCAAAF